MRESSNPTATPTSIPSLVSSASSVRTKRSRSSGSSVPAASRTRLFVAGIEPAALGDRRRQHPLKRRRRPQHQFLGVAQPGRFG